MRMSKTVLLAISGAALVGCDNATPPAPATPQECARPLTDADRDRCRTHSSGGHTFITPTTGRVGAAAPAGIPGPSAAHAVVTGGFGSTAAAHAGGAS